MASNEAKGNSCMGNNGMASSIECKASKVTVSGQGCGTAYIPSPRCRRRRVGREEEASTNRQEKKKKERVDHQPPADRRERYTTRRGKKRIERQKKTVDWWLPAERETFPPGCLLSVSFVGRNGHSNFTKRAITPVS